jgi:hypothetical protein
VDILQGIHHPRIKYPEQIKEEEQAKLQSPQSRQAADQLPPPVDKIPQPKPISGTPAGPTGLVQQE